MLEEWQTGPSRFDRSASAEGRRSVPLAVIEAYRDGRLLPVADLDEGFIRPRYAGQLGISYMQAGLVCEYLTAAYGHEALAAMLAAYRRGEDTAGAVEAALDIETEALDEAFAAYLEVRLQGIDAGAFRAAVAEAREADASQNWAAAAAAARRAIAAYPYFVDAPSPYPILARAEARQGRPDRAIEALTAYWRAGGRRTAPLAALVGHLEQAERPD